ncbi:hypothetical protein IL38_24020 [Actinopolyspora erythraea]|uniref:PD-(D/E)XK endonuclease-like domain-containing protein n=1 Tax=Actinopolyspora erythraea TaxID=414996 RepID=A0ABR4WYR4_9ACTN|nr:PD-(D/E)XK nuclease family protein [Actinopolyspora erythraea]KGI79368.1 hypothetical protein IL38_24020 [Actinopolyspora erythraea]
MTSTHTDPPTGADDAASRVTEALAAAFRAFTADQQQARDEWALSMSGLGACARQGAYRVAETPASDEVPYGEKRPANLGTMQHAGLLPYLAAHLDAEYERTVCLTAAGLQIRGTADLYWPGGRMVLDLKTVGQHRLSKLRSSTWQAHRLQVAGYALAVHQEGLPVRWVAWLYMDRASGQERVAVEPLTPELAHAVLERAAAIGTYALDPDTAPREERGPGLSYACDECPWLRRCWGDDAAPGETGAQRIVARDDDGVAAAVAAYDAARSREKEAREAKEFARVALSQAAGGHYGDWELTWSQPAEETDVSAALELLRQAGIPPPVKAGSPSIRIRPARADHGRKRS